MPAALCHVQVLRAPHYVSPASGSVEGVVGHGYVRFAARGARKRTRENVLGEVESNGTILPFGAAESLHRRRRVSAAVCRHSTTAPDLNFGAKTDP